MNRRNFIKASMALLAIPAAAEAELFSGLNRFNEQLKFCPECQKQGLKSKVFPGICMSTALHCGNGFYDEDGVYHPPENCNTTTCHYSCSYGHSWDE